MVKIYANAEAGLFYGVQTLLQLLRPLNDGSFNLPEGMITDWPDLNLRFIHWDTKHHQDRLETLKHYLDWAAFFKVNAVVFEIYDKYEFPRHPIIGAPGAFTKAEMQELTSYALDRFIPVIPDVNYYGDINRELGLEYMLAPFKRMGIKKWQAQLEALMNNFGKAHSVDVRGLDN